MNTNQILNLDCRIDENKEINYVSVKEKLKQMQDETEKYFGIAFLKGNE